MKTKCLIVSSKYHAGHWSHISATSSLFEEFECETTLLINENFIKFALNKKNRIVKKIKLSEFKNYSYFIILFPSISNFLKLFQFLIFGKGKIIYLLHEPIETYLSFYRSGFSLLRILKLILINQINKLIILNSTVIILPSKKAHEIYKKFYKYLNKNILQIPLMFEDEFNLPNIILSKKIFISYIGTIASDHAFQKYCNYIVHACEKNLFNDKIFLIATSSHLDVQIKNRLLSIKPNVNIKIIEGKWLTNNEINYFYETSALVWNAYDRSTQSGVLPKAFMFGTPVLGNALVPNEYLINNQNGIYLKDNSDFSEITQSIIYVLNNLNSFTAKSRDTFLTIFHYKNYKTHFSKYLNYE